MIARPQLRRGWTTVRLFSGLGNQLFQYAAGRALAERTRTKLRFDVSYFGIEPHRSYALGDFHIRAKVVGGAAKTARFMSDHDAEARYAAETFSAQVVREPSGDSSPELLAAAPSGSFLCGYWQSEAYFAAHADKIRHELRPRRTASLDDGLRRIASAACSVAVHVRRGDIASDPAMLRRFGLIEADHYRSAAEAMLEQYPDARFNVFSDDPDWCREHLDLPGGQTIISGETHAFEDLALMAACDHAIIGNSTFAWWGAWLGETPGSLVMAPQELFPGEKDEPAGMIPERWIRV